MGRQIAVAATPKDEEALLAFIRSNAEVSLIESFAPSINELWASHFSSQMDGHWKYTIWNKAFAWEPVYAQVGEKAHDPKSIGHYYVSNTFNAPAIEFSRSDVAKGKYGRIYWAKEFAAPDGLDYDVKAFSAWYDTIIRWVKKHGKRQPDNGVYFLPDAFVLASKLTL